MAYKVGDVLTNEQLNNLPNNRGRKKLIRENTWWFTSMDENHGDWVVLETHMNNTQNSSRMRNRVTNLNKHLLEFNMDYKFSTKTVDDSILFMGRSLARVSKR